MSESKAAEAGSAKQPPRLSRSVRLLVAEVLEEVRNHVDVAASDLEEERARLEQALIFGVMALAFFVMGTIVLIFFILSLVWDTPYRNIAFIGAIFFFFSFGGIAFGLVIYTYQNKRVLDATRTMLQDDIDALVGRFREEP